MRPLAALLFCVGLAGCGETARLSVLDGTGPHPKLPPPVHTLLPTAKVADATGWPAGRMPVAAPGFAVNAFAAGLDHPRWLYVLPNGDVLVAETDAPPKPDDAKGIRGFFMKLLMKKAGSDRPSPNRIVLLRDSDGDGTADVQTIFMSGLNSPFGMALVGDTLYVADTDAVVKVPYHTGETQVTEAPVEVVDLPAGTINHHWTKNILASKDGTKLYATIGSNSNAGENGLAVEQDRARIIEIDLASGTVRSFATGLRNPNGLAWNPQTGTLWTVVNERDEIGSDLVPDYLTSVRDGAFYGWPYAYYGHHVDTRVRPQDPAMVAKAIAPHYALGPHTAALGLTFYTGDMLPARYKGGAFIGRHGSWNRNPPSGYDVVFVPFANGMPSGLTEEVLAGFLSPDGKAWGRPVGMAVDGAGALLVADDVGGAVWRVTSAGKQ